MAAEVQLGLKVVHHTPQSTNLATYAVVSEKGIVSSLLIVLDTFHTFDVFPQNLT